jgi:polyisoprenoid-binding protein YceI
MTLLPPPPHQHTGPGRFAIALLITCAAALPLHAADYRIDPERSHADFGVRLFWLSQIKGRFEQIDGDVTLSSLHDTAIVDAHITVDSIQMNSDRIRRWVLAPEFFDAPKYPSIHFVSEPISLAMLEKGGGLDGTLTLRGVTRPAHFELMPSVCPLNSPQACVISVRGTIQRSDFGMSSHRTAISDQVELGMMISLDYPKR